MYKEMKKIKTGNRSLINLFQLNAYQEASISQQSSVYCWSRKQTRKRRRISGFCQSIIFFGIKNVRVGGKILGSVGRSETHIFFFGLIYMYYYYTKYERDMVVGQEPAMGFSQNNFSLETSESKWVRFLAAASAHDTKWLRYFRHVSGGLTRFHSFSAAFPTITRQCRKSAAQSDPWGQGV